MATVSEAFAAAIAHHQAGTFGNAEVIYREILTILLGNPGLINNLSLALIGAGDGLINRSLYADDLPYFEEAHELNKNNPDALNGLLTVLNHLGFAAMDTKRYFDAVIFFERVCTILPDDLNAQVNVEKAREHFGTGDSQDNPAQSDDIVATILRKNKSVLKIGPFCQPRLNGPGVRYFDVQYRDGLINRSINLGLKWENTPEIDFVSPTGDLSIIGDKLFDAVLSSHCVEHQPDFITHINNVARILRDGGQYVLMIPDKRYCFDYFLPESTIADIIQANHERRTTHTIANIIKHRALITHNNTISHWAGDHGLPDAAINPDLINQAIREYIDASGCYIDCHAWQFTPTSFRDIVGHLYTIGMIKMRLCIVIDTVKDSNTFCAVLRS